MITTAYAEFVMQLLWMQHLTPQQLCPFAVLRYFFPKDIRGDTDVGEFELIHVLRLGRY